MPAQRALGHPHERGQGGKVDPDLFRLFVTVRRCYDLVSLPRWEGEWTLKRARLQVDSSLTDSSKKSVEDAIGQGRRARQQDGAEHALAPMMETRGYIEKDRSPTGGHVKNSAHARRMRRPRRTCRIALGLSLAACSGGRGRRGRSSRRGARHRAYEKLAWLTDRIGPRPQRIGQPREGVAWAAER